MNQTKLKAGDRPMIGVDSMIDLAIGWTEGDGTGHDGYNVADYFDSRGCYRGPDAHGIEPIFREMSEDEVNEYLGQES